MGTALVLLDASANIHSMHKKWKNRQVIKNIWVRKIDILGVDEANLKGMVHGRKEVIIIIIIII